MRGRTPGRDPSYRARRAGGIACTSSWCELLLGDAEGYGEDLKRGLADSLLCPLRSAPCDPSLRAQGQAVAWGAAQLYALTGDAKYAQLSLDIWQWTMDTQTPEGLWLRHPEYSSLEEQPLEYTVDAAVESGLYMFELAHSLSGYLVKEH